MAGAAQELLEHELGDIYDAENKLLNALETMATDASDERLATKLREHKRTTREQLTRLERVFTWLDKPPQRHSSDAINGILEEYIRFKRSNSEDELLCDAFATGAALKLQHYEIAAYRALIRLCCHLGMTDAARLLQQNLREEERTAADLEVMIDAVGRKLTNGRKR